MKTIYLLLFLILVSCATTNFTQQETINMDSWLGYTKAELVQKWGPPTKISSDEQGGEIYTFDKTITMGQFPGQIYGNNNSMFYTQPRPATIIRSRMFYINKEGKIYHWISTGREGY